MSILDLKPTRGSARHIETVLRSTGYSDLEIKEALHQFIEAHVESDARLHDERRRHYNDAVKGMPGAEGLEVVYLEGSGGIAFSTSLKPVPERLRLGTALALNERVHFDHLRTINTFRIVTEKTSEGERDEWRISPRHATLTAQAAQGSPNALAELGIAQVRVEAFPAAFVEPTSSWHPVERRIRRVETAPLPAAEALDVFEYIDSMRRDGRLPLATAEDSRRFVMLLASPLLRRAFVGLLGMYWIHGTSGSGKDLLAAVVNAVWSSVGLGGAQAVAEIGDPNGHEDRRTLGRHPDVVYVRLKEAGKRGPKMLEATIQMTGTPELSVRPLYQDERSIPNTFTFVADSVESIPDRREISRRTVVIEAAGVVDGTDTMTVVTQFSEDGPRIVRALKERIEAQGAHGLGVSSSQGRPLAQEALSSIFGAALDVVKGDGLEDLFAAMVAYCRRPHGVPEYLKGDASKLPKIAHGRRVFSSAHFVETMQREDGYRAYFETLKHGKFVAERIFTETDYAKTVGRHGAEFFTLEVGGKKFGLRFVDARKAYFVFGEVDATGTRLVPQPIAGSFPAVSRSSS